jgi:hypothetical protein
MYYVLRDTGSYILYLRNAFRSFVLQSWKIQQLIALDET